MNMKPITIKSVAATVALLAGLVGCGSSGTSPAASSGPAPKATATRLTSCGLDLKVTTPPKRAIALEQNATEIMLALGLADRMAGTSYQTDPVLPELADAYAQVPALAKQYPAHESVLAKNPDFLYSTLSSAFAPEAAGPRAGWSALGVPAYLSSHDCEEKSLTRSTVTFDAIFDEIGDIARVFDVDARGTKVVDGLRARLDRAVSAAPATSSREVMWYYSGTRTPYVAGKGGLPSTISHLLHSDNAFDDVGQKWFAAGWEKIAERDPDVIVLADLTRGGDGDSAASKMHFLRTDPVTSQLDAVRHNRFIVVPGSAVDPSLRSVSAVEAVSEGLRALHD